MALPEAEPLTHELVRTRGERQRFICTEQDKKVIEFGAAIPAPHHALEIFFETSASVEVFHSPILPLNQALSATRQEYLQFSPYISRPSLPAGLESP